MSRLLCTFWCDEHLLAVPVGSLREVLVGQAATVVPLAPEAASGLLNLRGEIITVIDLRARLRLPPCPDDHPGIELIVETADGTVSLHADRIGQVVEVAPDAAEPPPLTLDHRIRDLVSEVCKLHDQLLLVLDIERTALVGALQ